MEEAPFRCIKKRKAFIDINGFAPLWEGLQIPSFCVTFAKASVPERGKEKNHEINKQAPAES